MNKIIEGVHDALAFSRIQELIDEEIDRLERNFLEHPGSASRTTSEFLRGLQAAQALFGKAHKVKRQKYPNYGGTGGIG